MSITNNNLTVVIVTFKSNKIVESCIQSIDPNLPIIVIENSNDYKFKDYLTSKFKNVDCYLTGENKGYSVANNIGLLKVKTDYALVLNPDTKLEKKALENFFITVKKIPDFWLIGPAYQQKKDINYNKKDISQVENLKGFAIFFNLKKFKNNFFDENFFLYFEEIDLCKKVKMQGGLIYLDPSIKIFHHGSSSVDNIFEEELEKNRNWHWMWSTFYFHKKYKGFFLALLIVFPKLFSAFIKSILFFVIFNKIKRDIYFNRVEGLINSILGRKSWKRPTID
tara:strand:- start:2367 stop:3206 length:840 start_codon:yes stop_codon:yes gene_type:complete